jgi:recombination protein RecA
MQWLRCSVKEVRSVHAGPINAHFLWRLDIVVGTAAFIDAEHAMDPVYAKNLGVNVDDLLLCQVSTVS